MSIRSTLAAAAVVALIPSAAFAYVDPSAGSILLQLLLGGFAGLVVAVKLFYRRLLARVGRRPSEAPTQSADDSPTR